MTATTKTTKVATATTSAAKAKATTPRTRKATSATPAAPAPAEAPAAKAPAALIQYRSRRDETKWLHYGVRSKAESAIHFLSTKSATGDREWRAVDAATGAILGERGLIAAEPATAA